MQLATFVSEIILLSYTVQLSSYQFFATNATNFWGKY